MNKFSKWLVDMGQDPRTIVRDVVWFVIKFYIFLHIIFLPLHLFFYFFVPRFPAGPGSPATASWKPGSPQFIFSVAGFCIYFTCAILVMISILGGWFRLGRRYPAPRRFREGQKFAWQSAGVGSLMGGYENVLTVRVAPQGLYLSCPCMAWLLHRPILIPWTEVKAAWHKKLGFKNVLFLTVGAPKIATVVLVKKNLIAAVGPHVAETEKRSR